MRNCQLIVLFFCFATLCQAQEIRAHATTDNNNSVQGDTILSVNKRTATAMTGDVNGDSKVDIVDVVDLARYLKGTARSVFVKSKADLNGDGKVNKEDLNSLSRLILEDFPPMSQEEEEVPLRGDSNASPTL